MRATLVVLALTLACLVAEGPALPADAQVTEKVLWSFGAGGDGIGPSGGLVMDANGNLYGTTSGGGNNGIGTEAGVAFKLTPAGQESVLWNFGIGYDGQSPRAGVILDNSGNLYGTTGFGGLYDDFSADLGGTLFKLTAAGQESILWNFGNGNDGRLAYSSLITDANGNFFGTTTAGGTYGENIIGFGTAYELTPDGQETVLWNFGNETDGVQPSSRLVIDASGNLYGTTTYGGAFGPPNPPYKGSGVLFKLTPSAAPSVNGTAETTWTESILWNFGNGSDGAFPNSVIMDGDGNLLGTTAGGGAHSGGTVFELTPDGQETILWNFGATPDGAFPSFPLLMDAGGNLYGVTGGGGANLSGTVFEISAVASGGQIALSSQHIQFPQTAMGGSSSYQLAIRNTGKGQLTGNIVTPPAPFGLQGSASFNLAPRTQTTITLTFNPAAADR